MPSKTNSFQKAVFEAVQDHLAKYGFRVKDYSHDYVAYAESDMWELQVVNTHRFASVRMCLQTEAHEWHRSPWRAGASSMSGPRAKSTAPVDLFRVLQIASPHLKESQRYSRSLGRSPSATVRSEVRRQFRTLAEHCALLLEGDLSIWEEIREQERWDYGVRKLEDENWDDYTQRLRASAQKAYRQGNHHEAVDYYHRLHWIGDNLSFPEMVRFWWAGLRT